MFLMDASKNGMHDVVIKQNQSMHFFIAAMRSISIVRVCISYCTGLSLETKLVGLTIIYRRSRDLVI